MKTANAVVRHLETTIPVYDVSEQGYSLVDGRPVTCRGTELRRRVGFLVAVSVAVGLLAGWGAGEGRAPSWDAYAGVRPEPTILGLTVTHIMNLGLDIPADAR